jgi:putative phosphoesterase
MKIGVISDTHLEGPSPLLKKVAAEYFHGVDLILHAGDLTSLKVLEAFNGKKVIAVAGNNDPPEVKKKLPAKEIISVNQFKIGLTHGWGFPVRQEKKLTSFFKGVDCIVFGHTHWSANHHTNGILYFNPGSFSGGISSLWRRSIGLLTIAREIRGHIIRF